jgi:hypothetical protein
MSASASPASRAASAAAAAQWMSDQQTDSGAFFSPTLRVDLHAEALAAVVAGGIDESTLEAALAYIEENGEAGATEGARTGRLIAGVVAGGEDPTAFGGVDYEAILTSQFDPTTGTYMDTTPPAGDFFSNLIAANGDIAADGLLPTQVKDYILGQQCTDGGFAFGGVADCAFNDVDTTALAINALANSGLTGSDIDNALDDARARLLEVQTDNGGFAFCCDDPNFSSDSTGLALTAISAMGEDAEAHPWLQADGDDPVQALETLQTDEGSFRFAEEDFNGDPITEGNSLSTVNATPGMAGESYPIQAAEPDPDPTPTPSAPPDDDGNDVPTTVDSETDQPRITLPDTGPELGDRSIVPALLVTAVAALISAGALRKKRAP